MQLQTIELCATLHSMYRFYDTITYPLILLNGYSNAMYFNRLLFFYHNAIFFSYISVKAALHIIIRHVPNKKQVISDIRDQNKNVIKLAHKGISCIIHTYLVHFVIAIVIIY